MSLKQIKFISKLIFSKAADENKILKKYQINHLESLTASQASDCIDNLMKMPLQEHSFWELYGNQDPTRTN